MQNPHPVSGQPQRDPLDSGKNAPTSEKFKKVMAVDDSDASQQQNKRNPTRQTDEEEGEEDKQIEAKPDLFSELMSKKQTTEFSLGGKRQTSQEVSQNGSDNENLFKNIAAPSSSTDQDSINLKSKDADQSQNGPSYTSPPAPSTPPPLSTASTPPDTSEDTPPSSSTDQDSINLKSKDADQSQNGPSYTSPPAHSTPPPLSTASTPPDTSEDDETPSANKRSHDHFKELNAIEQKLKKLHPSHPKAPPDSAPMSPPPLVSMHHEKALHHVPKKEKEKLATPQSDSSTLKQPLEGHPHPVASHHDKDRHLSSEKREKEGPVLPPPSLIPSKQPQEGPQPLQAPTAIETSSTSPLTTTPPYAQFPPQVFELFQKLVGMMTVMQFQGKTTTSIVLHMPNSGLDGAHIDIEHYDTAPHAFNISFFSSPEGQKILDANITTLEQQLRSNLPQFEISVKKPLLLSETKEERRRRDTQVKKSKS